MPLTRSPDLLALALAAAALAAAGQARAGDGVAYDLDARVAPEGDRVEGTVTVTFTNGASAPLDHLVLLLYGRALSRPHPALNDLTYERVYPRGFSRGDLSVTSAIDARGAALPEPSPVPVGEIPGGVLPPGTVAVQPLPAPLGPGETTTVTLGFAAALPRRFGTWGAYREQATLTGGWYPYVAARTADGRWALDLPAPIAAWRAEVSPPPGWTTVVNGRVFRPGEPVVLEAEARHLSLVTGRRLHAAERRTAAGRYTYCYLRMAPLPHEWRALDRTLDAALGTLADLGVPLPEAGPVLVEAPLRARLTEPAEGMVLVTDRLYHTDPIPTRFEDPYIARAVMAALLGPAAHRVEADADAPDIAEGVAWWLVPRYLERRFVRRLSVRDVLQPFGAIPDVEQMLQTPAFSFYDEYLGNPYASDPLGDDVSRWQRRDMGARVLFGKLAVRVGAASMGAAVLDYVRSLARPDEALPWLAALRRRTGVDTAEVWRGYRGPHPRMDLSVRLESERGEDGRRETRVTARRDQLQGDPDVPERVGIRVQEQGRPFRAGHAWHYVWDSSGDGAEREVTPPTSRRVAWAKVDERDTVLEVDAQGRALKVDNRVPRALRVSLLAGVRSFDLATGDVDGYLGLGLRRYRDSRHQWYAQLFRYPSALAGIGFGYNFYFGRPSDGLWRRNRIGVYVDGAVLDPNYSSSGRVPLSAGASIGYRYESRRASIFPTRGFRFEASLFGGYELARSRTDPDEYGEYVGASVEAIALGALSRDHVLALRVKAGLMTEGLPHRLFLLGGADDLRGLPAGSALGPGKLFAGVEWRHVFYRDLDVPLPLQRLRGVQGALFAEAGWVGTHPENLDEWRYGVGYGLRFYLDLLGVLPSIGGFDVAFSPHAPEGNLLPLPVQVYVVGGQSF